jgi:predicted TIM-barrel fold metal-dependent hydrolase
MVASTPPEGAGAVDFHTYLQPTSFLARLRRRRDFPRIERVSGAEVLLSGPGVARPIRPEQNDIERRLALMDAAGIGVQVLRLQNVSGVDALDPVEGLEVAMAANDELSELAKRHPSRFAPFAAFPASDESGARRELARAIKELGLWGIATSVSHWGEPIDHPRYSWIFDAAAELEVPLLLLPNHPTLVDRPLEPFGWFSAALGFQVDLSIVALRLLASCRLDPYPRLDVILANTGGILPFVTKRLDHFWTRAKGADKLLSQPPSIAIRRFHFGTASTDARTLKAAAQALGADRMVFGSDYPSFDLAEAIGEVRMCGLAAEDIERMLASNAARILARRGSALMKEETCIRS